MIGQRYTQLCEGLSLIAIKDTMGWEIGFGHNGPDIHEGLTWTPEQAEQMFDIDYARALRGAEADYGDQWEYLDEVRQAALTDMAFEMGKAGLGEFSHMLAACRAGYWQAAHDACLNSAYAKQVSSRANRTANMLLTGQWAAGFDGE